MIPLMRLTEYIGNPCRIWSICRKKDHVPSFFSRGNVRRKEICVVLSFTRIFSRILKRYSWETFGLYERSLLEFLCLFYMRRWNSTSLLLLTSYEECFTVSVLASDSNRKLEKREILWNCWEFVSDTITYTFQSIYCASQRKPSPYPCLFRTEHMNSSSGRPGISLRETLP